MILYSSYHFALFPCKNRGGFGEKRIRNSAFYALLINFSSYIEDVENHKLKYLEPRVDFLLIIKNRFLCHKSYLFTCFALGNFSVTIILNSIYQFIGEDNIYFYAIAQTGLFTGLQVPKGEVPDMEKVQRFRPYPKGEVL